MVSPQVCIPLFAQSLRKSAQTFQSWKYQQDYSVLLSVADIFTPVDIQPPSNLAQVQCGI